MLHDLPRTHLAIALIVLLAMLAGAAIALVRALRRPRPHGIRVDLVAEKRKGDSEG